MTGDCRCGDYYCVDTFGRATAGQDRSGCCQYCGWFDCDVCGWSAAAAAAANTGPAGWVPGDPAPF